MTPQRGKLTPPPLDARVDRRSFLRRLGALSAAASAGSLDAVWRAGPVAARTPPPVQLPRVPVQETDPAFLTVIEAASLLRDGSLGPVELAEACLARIQAWDGVYQAFNLVTEAAALEAAGGATSAEAGYGTGILRGIPLAMKDNFFTAGVRTTANSHIFRDFIPEFDAEVWARLRMAGAVMVGKTQMGPLATSRATTPDGEVTTRNAWAPGNPGVSPGGSSSGSATAVAAGMALAATDRRLHYQPRRCAGAHGDQAHHGSGLAAGGGPADLHPGPPGSVGSGCPGRGASAAGDGGSGSRRSTDPGPARGP